MALEGHKGIILLALTAASALAQGTWNDLTFGKSVAEVRASLSKQDLTLQRSDDVWLVEPGWDLKLPGIKSPTHFAPRLSFSNSDKLERILLILDTELHKSEGVPALPLTAVLTTSVYAQLVGKYGVPARQAGVCEKISLEQLTGRPGEVDCNVLWQATGQTIALYWTYNARFDGVGNLHFRITYMSAQSSGL